jgi:hypothetical protein
MSSKKPCLPARRPNIVILLPSFPHDLSSCLHGLKDTADYKVYSLKHPFSEDTSFPDPNVDSLGIFGVSKDLLEGFITKYTPNVTWIHSFSAGVDTIMCDTLRARDDILVTNAKGAFSESLAEFALFGMMYFAKKLPLTLGPFLNPFFLMIISSSFFLLLSLHSTFAHTML